MLPIIATALMIALPSPASASDGDFHAVIDWAQWDRIVTAHVVDGTVDYDAIADDRELERIVDAIAAADLEGSDLPARLSFYINAYNVLAVQAILNGRSPRTNLGKLGFFYRQKFTVAGERTSLHALEKRHLRQLGEPRIHFAIVCASASCPPLRSRAYLPMRLEEQLEDNTRRFVNDRTKNRFDLDAGTARVSKIFKWFAKDFGQEPAAVERYLARYVDDDRIADALGSGRLRLRYLDYDWSLNGTFESGSKN